MQIPSKPRVTRLARRGRHRSLKNQVNLLIVLIKNNLINHFSIVFYRQQAHDQVLLFIQGLEHSVGQIFGIIEKHQSIRIISIKKRRVKHIRLV